jgi:hypothetical protein
MLVPHSPFQFARTGCIATSRRFIAATVSPSLHPHQPTRVQLRGAKLAQVNLEGAVLHVAQFDGADLRQCIAIGADFTDSSFKEASLCKGNFQNACLRGAKAIGAQLTEANLHEAVITRCDFTRADLTDSILTVKDLADAIFHEAVMTAVVPPPNNEVGPVKKEIPQPEWDKEGVLKQVYVAARRFVAQYIGLADSEDTASEVVVYLLSHPKELERLRTLDHDPLIAASRQFALRRLSPYPTTARATFSARPDTRRR